MADTSSKPRFSAWVSERLPTILILLFVLQPLMDILSFWTDALGMGNALTLLLRFGVLAGFTLLGFCLSEHKQTYLLLALVLLTAVSGHIYACSVKGYLNPVSDLTNFVRVVQMPIFTFCFITALRRNRRCYRAIELGCQINFWIIAASLVLSLITGTTAPTYEESGFGLIGWFSTTNAQSAILSILVPIVITISYRRRNFPLFVLYAAAAFAQMYFLGTRLALLTLVVTVVGLVLIALLTKNVAKKYFLVLFVMIAICAGTIKLSPMYQNQMQYQTVMAGKQNDAETMMTRQAKKEGTTVKISELTLRDRLPRLRIIYRYYAKQLCLRYGVYKVMEANDYSTSVIKIMSTRPQKIIFCSMLMDEHPAISRVFGMELDRMIFHDKTYDVENDFHGIYFLYGWYGFALMVLFLGYFIYLIVRSLVRNFRAYFTIEAGAFGMSFCLALLYAYNTAGVLRRPNSSFYLSMLLAVIYYLTQLRYYPPLTEGESEVGA